MRSSLLAICRDPRFCIQKSVFDTLKSTILANIDGRIPLTFDKDDKLYAFVKTSDGNAPMQVTDYMGNAESIAYWRDLTDEDRIINVVRLQGVMTRGGDACSYGSKDLGAALMKAADIKQTIAHVIVADTPGGQASTLTDFRHAINYCHDRGQKVYLYADGDVASGGAFLSAICDGVYFQNPNHEIGSLGMYCAFFTLENGAKNTVTQETYREYYAEASSDKNKFYRAAAEGDMSEVEKMVEHDLAQIIADLKQDRPSIKDKHLTGKMFPAKEVKGSLVDGFCSLAELASLAIKDFDKRKGAALPRKDGAPSIGEAAGCNPKKKSTQLNNDSMKQYTHMAAFIGEESFESDKEGCVTLQPHQADAMEEKAEQITTQLDTLATENTDLKQTNEAQAASITSLTTANAQLTTELEAAQAGNEALATANTALEAANTRIAELEAEATAAATAAQEAATAAQEAATAQAAEVASLQEQLQTAQDAQASLEAAAEAHAQTVADLKAEIEDLSNGEGAQPNAGESPATNGAQVTTAVQMEQAPAYDPTVSVAENARRQKEYETKLYNLAATAQ